MAGALPGWQLVYFLVCNLYLSYIMSCRLRRRLPTRLAQFIRANHFMDAHLIHIYLTLKGFASHWVLNQAKGRLETDRTARREKGEQQWKGGWLGAERKASSLLLRHVETRPPAEPVKALHHVRHAGTPSWVIWSLWGMRRPVTYKWEAAHADTCATWSRASKMISKKSRRDPANVGVARGG